MPDQKNLILAIVLSIAIMLGFEFLYSLPKAERERARQAERLASQKTEQTLATPSAPPAPGGVPTAPAAPGVTAPVDRATVLGNLPRVRIETPEVSGSIALAGARIDDLSLLRYRETTNPQSPPITLLSPAGTAHPYLAEFGWVAATQGVVVPTAETVWSSDAQVMTRERPLKLSWDNGQGLRFERSYTKDGDYMFAITDRVINTSAAAVSLFPYGLASRTDTPATSGFFILHEGPVAVLGGTLKELSYSDLQKGKPIEQETTGGWIGITDKYWLVAVIPNQTQEVKARFTHTLVGGRDKYQVDWFAKAPLTVEPGGTIEVSHRLFAGAKLVRLLDSYADILGVHRFDLAIDFGWFYFLTKPIFYILEYFNRLLGNFGLAILLLTVLIKLLFFPLANKSYRAMSKMKLLQPEMEKLKERFGEDRQRMSQEMMALYKREGANPLSGCLPIVIQIPVFFALYKVLFVTIEMRHAPFYGWIKDLSAPDPTSVFNLFGLIPLTLPDFMQIGAWPLIMGLTMFLQQKMNPQPPDPVQAKIFLFMPIIFTVMLAPFPAGLVIYWAWNNVLSVTQQWVIMRGVAASQKRK